MDPLNPVTQSLLTLAGLLAGILSYHDYKAELRNAICSVGEEPGGCKLVYMLPEALVLGRVHLSQLAPIYFAFQLLLFSSYLATGSHITLLAYKILWIAGALLVPYLVYLELVKARAVCLWCTIMHIIILLQAIVLTLA
ncbi:MAG: hypothetical protein F7C08_01895 [Desulfurococcales archaeon]|nr:hypothetical protein [Desulfurococcales archaeon]MCE4605271.1 hypothetical protein [Desulfurococcales archaeon]